MVIHREWSDEIGWIPKTLIVYCFDDGNQIFEIPWDDTWQSYPIFQDNETLTILIETTRDSTETWQSTFFTINIFTGMISDPHTTTSTTCTGQSHVLVGITNTSVENVSCIEIISQFPNFVPGDFYTRLPPRNVFLYNRCNNGEIAVIEELDNRKVCAGPSELVVYGLDNQETLEVLIDAPDFNLLRGTTGFSSSLWKIGLSPSGQYLSYVTTSFPPSVYIYDIKSDQYNIFIMSDQYNPLITLDSGKFIWLGIDLRQKLRRTAS